MHLSEAVRCLAIFLFLTFGDRPRDVGDRPREGFRAWGHIGLGDRPRERAGPASAPLGDWPREGLAKTSFSRCPLARFGEI